MDCITQTVLGAAAAGAILNHKLRRSALVVGGLGGLIPDWDAVLKHISDPALPWQYHRHFTHALVFIPVAGILAAAPFLVFPKLRTRTRWVIAAGMIGAATHGLLDACTSFGTHLLWPFANSRAAWDIVSIVDPILELPFWVLMLLALIVGRAWPSRVALVWFLAYLGFGVVQHERAADVQAALAEARGHVVERGRVMPTFGNSIIWRSVYEYDGRLFADAVRLPVFAEPEIREGERSIAVVHVEHWFSQKELTQREQFVVRNFAHFADQYVAWHPDVPGLLGDMRYSRATNNFDPIWGLRFVHTVPPDVQWVFRRSVPGEDNERMWRRLLTDIRVGGPGYVPLEVILSSRDDRVVETSPAVRE